MTAENLFAVQPDALPEEVFEDLLTTPHFRVERIVSKGHASPPDFWYDQDEHEWVVLLQGAARVKLEAEPNEVVLLPGDYLHLSAHCRHRVTWTEPGHETVWLAIHYSDAGGNDD